MEETKTLIDWFVASKLERIAFAEREQLGSGNKAYWDAVINQNKEFIEDLIELKESIK